MTLRRNDPALRKLTENIDQQDDERIDLDDMFEAQAASVKRLAHLRVLELNADFQPMSLRPVSTQPWTQVMFWLVKGWDRIKNGEPPIITVVEEYEDEVRTVSGSYKIPSVIAHTRMRPVPSVPRFSRNNLLLRDDYTCQYTGKRLPESELNFDHVIPQSRGGKTNWTNIVACDKRINLLKANRTPSEAGLKLIRDPYVPTVWELREKGRNYPPQYMHETWESYLYFNVNIEED